LTQPWYDDDVIKQIKPPSSGLPNQLTDETPRVARIFPVGVPRDAAMARLRRNGFDCQDRRDQAEGGLAICSRKISAVVCWTAYVITFSGDVVKETKATSQTVCL
jgi:hypothetical protein